MRTRAPVSAKAAWDPTGDKKNALRLAVAEQLPDLEIRSGGSTSIDVTERGVDKAFGMRKLSQETGIPLDQMLFLGDRLDVGGNDHPVLALGVRCRLVANWEETATVVEAIISALLPVPTLPLISTVSNVAMGNTPRYRIATEHRSRAEPR